MISKCYVCNSEAELVYDFGLSPMSNYYAHNLEDAKKHQYPLILNFCPKCCHLQTQETVLPEKLFKFYSYVSGTTGTLGKYFSNLSEVIMKTLNPNSVLDVASNDGSFLKNFLNHKKKFVRLIGIDPAENLRNNYPKEIEIVTDFMHEDQDLRGFFDFISAQNVFAHSPKPISLLRGISKHMNNSSVLFLQTSQAFMLPGSQYDTVYHEHFSFFSLRSTKIALEKAGLKSVATLIGNIHGDSLVNIVIKEGASNNKIDLLINELTTGKYFKFLSKNETFQLNNQADIYRQIMSFKKGIEKSKHIFKKWESKNKKYQQIMVGSAAKSVTWMTVVDFRPNFILDENLLKIGKFLPNCKNPILPFEGHNFSNCLFVIGAWNFYDEIKIKLKKLGYGKKNNKIVRFFPNFFEEDL